MGMPLEGGEDVPIQTEETFWQKLWRFVLGLLGLDSGTTAPGQSVPETIPVEPVPAGGGKG
jgi:hypothetical protein